MGTLWTDTEQEGQTRRKTVNMEGFSIPTASIHEEWLDLADIVNNDLENDLEKKKLSDISGFDVVGLFNNNNNSDKSFQRQSSYLDIFKEIEGEELMLGIDSVETSICIDHAYNNNNNNNNIANATVVAASKEMTSSLTGYSHYSPASPTDSWISTEDFPEELEELQPFEMGDKLQVGEEVAATFTFEVIKKTEEASEEEMEEQSDSDEVYVPESSKPVRRKSRAYGNTFKENDAFEDAQKDSSDSDPDFDPEDFEEVRSAKKSPKSRKEPTSDYESEELSEEEKPQKKLVSRRSRKPSRTPIPQQRKKGSTLKISQWIVELLRNPETNPSVIMWEDEPAGKFRVINSNAFAQLWAKVKKNPAMNYEKLPGDEVLLPQQGDRDGEGRAADVQVWSQHAGLPCQGQKRPKLPIPQEITFCILKMQNSLSHVKIHSVPRQKVCVNTMFLISLYIQKNK